MELIFTTGVSIHFSHHIRSSKEELPSSFQFKITTTFYLLVLIVCSNQAYLCCCYHIILLLFFPPSKSIILQTSRKKNLISKIPPLPRSTRSEKEVPTKTPHPQKYILAIVCLLAPQTYKLGARYIHTTNPTVVTLPTRPRTSNPPKEKAYPDHPIVASLFRSNSQTLEIPGRR